MNESYVSILRVEEGDMATQKKFLLFAILLAFFLSVNGADNSYAKSEKRSPKKFNVKKTISGTVAEIVTDDVEFDFLRIRSKKSEQWVAAPKKDFNEGDTVKCKEGFVMENYHIKALDRSFEQIIFTNCSKK